MNANRVIFTNDRGVSVTMQDILTALDNGAHDVGLENGLQDLKDNCTSALFGQICEDVGVMLNDSRALWIKDNNKCIGLNKKYILLLSDTYIELCTIYDKRICLEYFQNFIGVHGWYLTHEERRMYENDNVLNSLRGQLMKTFDDADNTLQLSKARDSKQSILNLAYNNYRHNWTGQIKEKTIASTVKTLDDIKRERLEKSAAREQIPNSTADNIAQTTEKP